MSKTIYKQSVKYFIARAKLVKVFSIDNGFRGATVPSDVKALEYAQELGARFTVSVDGKSGTANVHSNLWYAFDLRPE